MKIEGAGMKNLTILSCLVALLSLVLVLGACNSSATSVSVTTTTKVTVPLLTVPPAGTEPFTIPDSGVLEVNGQIFNSQRVYESIDRPTLYRGVIFAPKDFGTVTPTGVSGWYTVTFTDGTMEDLQFAGTLMAQTDSRLTKHGNPRAGIMMAYGDNRWVMYVLVSVE
jgi:hypothetical protein